MQSRFSNTENDKSLLLNRLLHNFCIRVLRKTASHRRILITLPALLASSETNFRIATILRISIKSRSWSLSAGIDAFERALFSLAN